MDYQIRTDNKGLSFILSLLFCIICNHYLYGQDEKASLRYSGQMSGYVQYTPDLSAKLWLGERYIPQLNSQFQLTPDKFIDFELSANLYAEQLFIDNPLNTSYAKVKPYRIWTRYSTRQMELRVGLQKINFGSALMFRPLMWFDKMDPRDPLQMTDGVWSGLFRYYFLNNANIWIWLLYGNKETKGWEITDSYRKFPEIGGRLQYPVPNGEVALSYHFRKTDFTSMGMLFPNISDRVAENRLGLDMKLNLEVGLWLESSWTNLNANIGELTNQTMLTLGTDYTFDVGNGLSMTFEQLIYMLGEKKFTSDRTLTFSGLSLSYPVSLFDNLQAMFYYDWTENLLFNFVNWQKQYNNITLHLIGYWNPTQLILPITSGDVNRFVGKGLQFMIVWNH